MAKTISNLVICQSKEERETMPAWYGFEARGYYCGRCLTTRKEIKRIFPHSIIEGDWVIVLGPPALPKRKANRKRKHTV